MSGKPPSPFAGLDKALLRSTREQRPTAEDAPPHDAGVDVVSPSADATVPSAPLPPATEHEASTAGATTTPARTRGTTPARKPARTVVSRDEAHDEHALIETIRRAVKVSGKDVSFTRLTPEEKRQLADVVYTYKRQGKKTTENEIMRIALNMLLEDYHASGEQSVLARVIDRLLA